MSVIDQATKRFPHTNAADWRQIGEAAIYKDCTVDAELVRFVGPAICYGGVIWGGEIWGGEIRGGVIRDGVIRGGVIRGGEIWGGEIRGGEIRGGVIRGGEIWGGEIRGGEIWGGEIWGGEIWGGEIWGGEIRGGVIRGGVIRGGVIRGTPVQLVGLCNYVVTIGEPGQIAVGCECHTPEEWRANIDEIAEEHKVDDDEKALVMYAVEIAAKWLIENPDVVKAEVEDPKPVVAEQTNPTVTP